MDTIRNEPTGPELTIGLRGLRTMVGGVTIDRDHTVRMQLPPAITLDDVAIMRQDLTELLRVASEQPDGVVELQNAAVRNDFATVTRVADQLRLTEKYLGQAGGGKVGELLLVGVIIAILIVASPSEPDPPPAPGPGPTPHPDVDAGTVDAGGDGG
jgi:hypothetical protein